MKRSSLVLALTVAFCAACPLLAKTSKPSPSQTPAPKPLPTNYRVPQITEPLKLSDFAAMEPLPTVRDKLLHISGFIQVNPKDGQPGTEQTDVWMAYTKTALYIVFICRDKNPAGIRGHLARRENILTDDNVSVLLDTFQDRRRGILFTVNPAGVQADAAWTENAQSDYSYDQVWDSEGRITPEGWMALVAQGRKRTR